MMVLWIQLVIHGHEKSNWNSKRSSDFDLSCCYSFTVFVWLLCGYRYESIWINSRTIWSNIISINMLIKYSYIKYVPVTQITKCISCTEKFCASYCTIPLILYARYFLFADVVIKWPHQELLVECANTWMIYQLTHAYQTTDQERKKHLMLFSSMILKL